MSDLRQQLIDLIGSDTDGASIARTTYEEAVCAAAANVADMIVRDAGIDTARVEIVVRIRRYP